MQWEIEFIKEEQMITLKYSGASNVELYIRSFEECISLAAKHGSHRVLVDTTDLKPALTAVEIYELPKAFDELQAERKTRYAMIMPDDPTLRKNLAFFETVCRNRGYLVKLFDDRESAVAWLKE